jgi:hypothetical protein
MLIGLGSRFSVDPVSARTTGGAPNTIRVAVAYSLQHVDADANTDGYIYADLHAHINCDADSDCVPVSDPHADALDTGSGNLCDHAWRLHAADCDPFSIGNHPAARAAATG